MEKETKERVGRRKSEREVVGRGGERCEKLHSPGGCRPCRTRPSLCSPPGHTEPSSAQSPADTWRSQCHWCSVTPFAAALPLPPARSHQQDKVISKVQGHNITSLNSGAYPGTFTREMSHKYARHR